MIFKGTVLQGINRIYIVQSDEGESFECRIKGKVLSGDEGSYNPLTAGDRVECEVDHHHPGKAMIHSRLERRNAFVRYNRKRNAPQIIASNFDQIVCVSSPGSPPFRPRFIDRVAASLPENARLLVVLNKMDQGADAETIERFEYYEKLGYDIHRCCALSGEGVGELVKRLEGKNSVFVGQSGVGKSTLLNRIRPDISQKTAEVSDKYNRGKHTTNFAVLFPSDSMPVVTDTPGIREIDVYGIEPEDLYHYYPDLDRFQGECRFAKCTHEEEPGCEVRAAVERGEILEDRYISYLNLLQDLRLRRSINEYR